MTVEEAVKTALDTLVEIAESKDPKTVAFNGQRLQAAETILNYHSKLG